MATQNYCLVDASGNVNNVIVYDGDPASPTYSPYTPPAGMTLQLDPLQQAGIGWTYNGTAFTNPNAGV